MVSFEMRENGVGDKSIQLDSLVASSLGRLHSFKTAPLSRQPQDLPYFLTKLKERQEPRPSKDMSQT